MSGLSHSLSLANFETIFANDPNKDVSDTYKLNFPKVLLLISTTLNLIVKK